VSGPADELAQRLSGAASDGATVRFAGGDTKRSWTGGAELPDVVEISTLGLDAVHEHNEGDLTAVVDAGVRMADLQERLAGAGQMLALDPPLGAGEGATVGGVVATADSGPLRHRYMGARDLVVGATLVLSDGTVVRTGGKVIKNVAGYDLAKLFTGSFGSLGAIATVSLRLHPLPPATATAVGRSGDPSVVADAASTLAHLRIELQSLDVRWEGGEGMVLARFGGAAAEGPAGDAAAAMGEAGLESSVEGDDDELWSAQREGQRSTDGAVVRVSGVIAELEQVLRAAERLGGRVVGRAGLGVSWVTLPSAPPADLATAVADLRRAVAPSPCVLLDAPPGVRAAAGDGEPADAGTVELMRRVKERFDPAGACAPASAGRGV
jgi:glycolate oxidase FAD binding subunit